MNFSNLQVQTDQGVMQISIDRPNSLNALNTSTIEELSLAIDQAASDDSTRVVVNSSVRQLIVALLFVIFVTCTSEIRGMRVSGPGGVFTTRGAL